MRDTIKEDDRLCYRCKTKLIYYTDQNKLILEASEFSQNKYIPPDSDSNMETEYILCDLCVRSLMIFLGKG